MTGDTTDTTVAPGNCVNDTQAGDTLTSYTMTIWWPDNTLTWSAGPGNTGAYSTPVATGTTQDVNGTTYYGYTSTWTGSIISSGGQVCTPAFAFESTSVGTAGEYYQYLVDFTATLNGSPLTASYGPLDMK